jgi:hypothetical protein
VIEVIDLIEVIGAITSIKRPTLLACAASRLIGD